MNKFEKPVMTISMFEAGDIVTTSGTLEKVEETTVYSLIETTYESRKALERTNVMKFVW